MADEIFTNNESGNPLELISFWWSQVPKDYSDDTNPKLITNGTRLQAQKMFFILDLHQNQFAYCSDSLAQLLGNVSREITLDFFLDILHPEEKDTVISIIEAAHEVFTQYRKIHVLSTILSLTLKIRNSRGHYLNMLWQLAPVSRTPEGKIGRIIGIFTACSTCRQPDNEVTFSVNIPEYERMLRQLMAVKLSTVIYVNLTKTERQILSLLMKGETSKEIACQLNVSTHTIRTHRQRIREKLNFKNTGQLISYAYKNKNALGLL